MRVVICEDNNDEQKCLVSAINEWADTKQIKVNLLCYNCAEEFLFVWPDIVADILFLDIKMKEMSGIKLAEKIRENDKNILIVFTSNFQQYSLKGYEVDALHFLVKPLSSVKLTAVLDKAYDIWYSREKDVVLVTNEFGQFKLFCRNIYYIKMDSHIAELHTENEIYEVRKTTEGLMKLLPSYFIRCHRSYIVNLLKVDCVYNNSLLLSTGEKLPISRKNAKDVNDTFVGLFRG